jgi:hypothetical protein
MNTIFWNFLNFSKKFEFRVQILVKNLKILEKIEKIPKNHIHCNIQALKVLACLNIWFMNNKYLKFTNT